MRHQSIDNQNKLSYAWLPRLQLLVAISLVSGCLVQEDLGTIEHVGTPTNEPSTFVVTDPDPLPSIPDDDDPIIVIDDGPIADYSRFWIEIEGGQSITTRSSDLAISVGTGYPTFLWYKIRRSSDCSGGEWIPFREQSQSDTVIVNDFTHNANNTYYAQFLEIDGLTSPCLSASIVQDDAGPSIVFSKYPASKNEEGATGTIKFNVEDISEIGLVSCALKVSGQSLTKPCHAGQNQIEISAMPVGQYSFEVEAVDTHGHKNVESVSWSVVSSARILTQTVGIIDNRKVDILFVIDNSGSMGYEQKSMANRVRNMLAIVKDLDYRIAVTTTDPNKTKTENGKTYYGDGDLIPIVGLKKQYWIDSSMNHEEAQNALGLTLQRSEVGSHLEQAIRATSRFLSKFGFFEASCAQSQFLRADANFAVVVISDENESASQAINSPENLMDQIYQMYNGKKSFSWHSIITKPGDVACKNGHGAAYGDTYKTLSELTGGIIGSVCADDYAAQVTEIASEIRNLIQTITLSCDPLATYPVTITKDGLAYSKAFTLEGRNVKFSEPLGTGEYKINFACLKQ